MRIDAHQHFWRLSRGDYDWLNAFPKIARDFLPGDLAPHLAAASIDRTVLVQAAPASAETEFLLELARTTPFVAGVVGWVNFEALDAPIRIAQLCENEKLIGLRPMIQDIADTQWMLRPELAPAIDAMLRGGLTLDALVKPNHLAVLSRFLDRYPKLDVVIDHGAKPDIAGQGLNSWATHIRQIARESPARCKLSGLVTEAGPGWNEQRLRPYVEVLLESFGPSRLMWGSDWPVVNLASDYMGWIKMAETLTRHLSTAERAAIFGGNAAAFYGLNEVERA